MLQSQVTGVVLSRSPIQDKGDGLGPHNGGLVTKKGDGSQVISVTFIVIIGDERCVTPVTCIEQR